MILYPRYLPVAGITICQNLILIKHQYKGNVGLLIHEQMHQEQMARVGTLRFWFMYLVSRKFRLAMEVDAYKAQIAAGGSRNTSAIHLVNLYFLGITFDEAYQLLGEQK